MNVFFGVLEMQPLTETHGMDILDIQVLSEILEMRAFA